MHGSEEENWKQLLKQMYRQLVEIQTQEGNFFFYLLQIYLEKYYKKNDKYYQENYIKFDYLHSEGVTWTIEGKIKSNP